MYFLEKSFKLPFGHRLSKHTGRCNNVHGHTMKCVVKLMAKKLNKDDMIIDFAEFKKTVNIFLDEFDHSLILNSEDTCEIVHCVKNNRRYVTIEGKDPTAEVLSKYLYYKIDNYIYQHYNKEDFCCYSVTVWENDTANCTYVGSDHIKIFLEDNGDVCD